MQFLLTWSKFFYILEKFFCVPAVTDKIFALIKNSSLNKKSASFGTKLVSNRRLRLSAVSFKTFGFERYAPLQSGLEFLSKI